MASSSNPEKVMTVLDHIRELRNRILGSMIALVVGFVVAFIFSDRVIALFTQPFIAVPSAVDKKLVMHSISEGFTTQVKIAAIAGLILSMPVHVFNLVGFVFPGLSRRQRSLVLVMLAASFVLILFGVYIGYFNIVPMAIAFLTNPYFMPPGVGLLLNYETNVFYVLTFMLWSILALQTPLILEVLLIMNVLNRRKVLKASRFVIVGIFIFAAIVTPSPDFISQLGVAIPLTVLYFLAILVAKVFRFGEGR
ncbi:MAG TPA: twin-arginine translocase subunit TatC [Rectinemataceae bacterium]|nr:twin-arginine translocase subunit TatC [Rectinemataceae bacterium]